MKYFTGLLALAEYWNLVEDDILGDPPKVPWWRRDLPVEPTPPVDPDVYQQASNLGLFKALFRGYHTVDHYGTTPKEEVKRWLMGRFDEDEWQVCEKICPQEVLREYKKHYYTLPEFPEYEEDRDMDLDR